MNQTATLKRTKGDESYDPWNKPKRSALSGIGNSASMELDSVASPAIFDCCMPSRDRTNSTSGLSLGIPRSPPPKRLRRKTAFEKMSWSDKDEDKIGVPSKKQKTQHNQEKVDNSELQITHSWADYWLISLAWESARRTLVDRLTQDFGTGIRS